MDNLKLKQRIAQLEAAIREHRASFDPIEDATTEDHMLWEALEELEAEVERLKIGHSAYVKTAEASDAYYQARLDAVAAQVQLWKGGTQSAQDTMYAITHAVEQK